MKKIVLGILFLCAFMTVVMIYSSQGWDSNFPFSYLLMFCFPPIKLLLSTDWYMILDIFNLLMLTIIGWFFIWYFYPFFKKGWLYIIRKRKEMIT